MPVVWKIEEGVVAASKARMLLPLEQVLEWEYPQLYYTHIAMCVKVAQQRVVGDSQRSEAG
jgi:hypothetical protein